MIEKLYEWKEHVKKDVLGIINLLKQGADKETLLKYLSIREVIKDEEN